tara:strand:+ start:3120 stop:3242 length:123 start_codon:yes stop_codon:yes gene_type:complete
LIASNLKKGVEIIALPKGSGIFVDGKKETHFGEIFIFKLN